MEYSLVAQGVITNDLGIVEYVMSCYDTLDDPEFAPERDDLLQHRSALELVRDRLSDRQRRELAAIDRHWRDNARMFNQAFARHHAETDPQTALRGFVTDAMGGVPKVPADHWWWQPVAGQDNGPA